ncbi:MAG TPA: SCO family protein [Oxalicibacterium sp.]|nr:SCO family protein [Oxalicibacterium sp.]
MMPRLRLSLLLLLLACGLAHAQARSVPPPPQTAFEQRLGAQLPLQTNFIDDDGKPVRLGSFFGAQPVVMVFGYYRCPNLCSTVMEGVLQTLAALDLPPDRYRLVAISIDPSETAAQAAAKKKAYHSLLGRADMHLLTGSAAATHELASVAGFHYAFDKASGQYAHPSGFLIATPGGAIARYFLGVRFNQQEVAQALRQAAAGHVGSLAERLLLLCAHFDPTTGKYSLVVMDVIRLLCLAMVAALLGWMLLRRKRRGSVQ